MMMSVLSHLVCQICAYAQHSKHKQREVRMHSTANTNNANTKNCRQRLGSWFIKRVFKNDGLNLVGLKSSWEGMLRFP